MTSRRNKKNVLSLTHIILIVVVLGILLVGLFLSVSQVNKPQETTTHATAATTLSFGAISPSTALQVGNSFSVPVIISPATNIITTLKMDIQYDPTKFTINSGGFVPNTAAFNTTIEGPVYSSGHVQIVLSTGSDTGSAITQPVTVGTLTLQAIGATAKHTSTQLSFSSVTAAYSIAPQDTASENVISTTIPLALTIASGSSAKGHHK